MTDWIYTLRERFTPAHRQDWAQYIAWSGFTHITELVTLDTILCCDRITDLTPADWSHNVQADGRVTWFTDLSYLRDRGPLRPESDQIIAAVEQPPDYLTPPQGFTHCGFDILEGIGSISVLTNCGQFPGIFAPADVNRWGLIEKFGEAWAIAQQIRAQFPHEAHCQSCTVWQVARTRIDGFD